MSGKMIAKLNKRRSLSWMKRRQAMLSALSENGKLRDLCVARIKYKKVMISNYALLPALFVLVCFLCWITGSLWIFTLSVFCYYALFKLHYSQRITKYEEMGSLTIDDYESTARTMNFCSMAGIIVTAVFSASALIL